MKAPAALLAQRIVPRRALKSSPSVELAVATVGAMLFAISSIRSIGLTAAGIGVPFFDWTFYAGAVNRWLAGEQIYPGGRISTLGSAAGSSYAYPPASVPLMLPFASWPAGAILWETLIVGTLLLGVWAVVRVGWPARPLLAFGFFLGLMAFTDGVVQGVAVANVNIATAGALGLIWAGGRRAGPLAGVLGVIKVFPIALAAPAGGRALAQGAALILLICLTTFPLVGSSAWSDYVTGLQASQPLCGDPTWVNYSLACVVYPFAGMFIAKWVGLLVGGVFIAIAWRLGLTFLGAAAATVAIIAPATEVHYHYFSIVFVLMVIGLATFNVRRNDGSLQT